MRGNPAGNRLRAKVPASVAVCRMAAVVRIHWRRNWIGRSRADNEEFREAWTNGTRYGEVKGYDGPPIPAPQLPPCR